MGQLKMVLNFFRLQDSIAQLAAEAQRGRHHQDRVDRGPVGFSPGSVEGRICQERFGAVVYAAHGGADIGHMEDQRRLGIRRNRHSHFHRFRKCSGITIQQYMKHS